MAADRHLITFRTSHRAPAAEAEGELRVILQTYLRAVQEHLSSAKRAESATLLKRDRVQLEAPEGLQHFSCADHRERGERLGELLNLLATVERTVDALRYFAQTPDTVVEACNPTTSDRGHDIELRQGSRRILVEVSDVAGDGNANGKMKKDLLTLLKAVRDHREQELDEEALPQLMLAVSPSSAAWLLGRATTPQTLGVRSRVLKHPEELSPAETHVIRIFPRELLPPLAPAAERTS